MSVRIVTDSAADIPADMLQTLNITTVPALVTFGTQTFEDRVTLSTGDLYARMTQTKTNPTTAAAAPGLFSGVYQRLVDEGHDVVSIHLASKLSGIYNSARLGAADFGDRVALVDSTNVTMAEGWLAIHAARAAQAGASQAEVVDLCQQLAPRTRVWALLDSLEFVLRGGRINQAQFLVGSLLRIKPMLLVRDGALSPLENVRTLRKAVERLVELAQAAQPLAEVAVLHAAAPELADEVCRRVAEFFPIDRIVVTEAGPAIGVHAGPGAVGIGALLAS